MLYLLDTHIILWWLSDDAVLSPAARQIIQDPSNVLWVSAASAWEIAIKAALGKLRAPENFDEALQATNIQVLSINVRHALWTAKLPHHHEDPFDRLLIAQADSEGLTFLTHDRRLAKYGRFVHLI